jgi:hypothetical protein
MRRSGLLSPRGTFWCLVFDGAAADLQTFEELIALQERRGDVNFRGEG